MNFREIEYFVQIAKDKSYTKAADHMFVSQPALSKMMKKLEEELGEVLFLVRQGGVELTDYGKLLYEKAAPLVNEFHTFQYFAHDRKEATNGTLRVAVTPMLSALYVIEILSTFRQKYPEAKIQLFENGSNAIRNMVKIGDADLGIGIAGDNREKLAEKVLFEDELVLCLRKDHPLAKEKTVDIVQLKDESFNAYSSASSLSNILHEECIKAGFERKVNITTSSIHVLLKMTETGNGIVVIPRPYAKMYAPDSLAIIPFRRRIPWVPCIMRDSTSYQTHLSKLFEEDVLNYFKSRKTRKADKA